MDFTCRYTLLQKNGTVSDHDERLTEKAAGRRVTHLKKAMSRFTISMYWTNR